MAQLAAQNTRHPTLLCTVSHQLVLLYCTYCAVLLLTPPACPLSEFHRYACTTPRLHAYTPTYLHVSITVPIRAVVRLTPR